MRKITEIFFILFFSIFTNAQAQYSDFYYKNIKPLTAYNYRQPNASLFPDSVKKEKKKTCYNSWCFGTSAVPLLNLDSYNSFLFYKNVQKNVQFNGLQLGAEIAERVRFGIGYYLLKPINLAPVPRDGNDTLSEKLNFTYLNIFSTFVFYEDFRWELSVPLSVGKAWGSIDTTSSKINKTGSMRLDSTDLATVGFNFEYHLIPWLGFGGGVGYRQAFFAQQSIREKINAPYYALNLKIFVGYLFKAVFNRKKLKEEKEEYLQEKAARKKAREEKKAKEEQREKPQGVEGIDKPENKKDY